MLRLRPLKDPLPGESPAPPRIPGRLRSARSTRSPLPACPTWPYLPRCRASWDHEIDLGHGPFLVIADGAVFPQVQIDRVLEKASFAYAAELAREPVIAEIKLARSADLAIPVGTDFFSLRYLIILLVQ
jgi:hypothetical protein